MTKRASIDSIVVASNYSHLLPNRCRSCIFVSNFAVSYHVLTCIMSGDFYRCHLLPIPSAL